MSRPSLRLAPDPFEAEFTPAGGLRQKVGASGRVHIDRPLHFLVLHRSDDPEHSVARRVASNSPAYLVWSPEDDLAAPTAATVGAASVNSQSPYSRSMNTYEPT